VTDLLTQAQAAVVAGLPREEALYPAQIFGVADQLGSLEVGKIADVVIFDGEPLARPVRVKMVLLAGKTVVPQSEGSK
jgi:imidazolonepropionase-like amidohydrolase